MRGADVDTGPDGSRGYVPTQARSRYLRHAADTKLMLRLRLAFVKCRRPQSTCLWNIPPAAWILPALRRRYAPATFVTQRTLNSCCASGLHSLSAGGLRVPAYGTYIPEKYMCAYAGAGGLDIAGNCCYVQKYCNMGLTND